MGSYSYVPPAAVESLADSRLPPASLLPQAIFPFDDEPGPSLPRRRTQTGVVMNNFQRYLAEEFAEDFEEGRLPRRDAIKLIASVTGSLVFAETILAACTPSLPQSQLARGAPDGRAEAVEFAGKGTQVAGYLARPSAEGTFPVILVCHENRGLTD